jgi:hypothetical protein
VDQLEKNLASLCRAPGRLAGNGDDNDDDEEEEEDEE